MSDRESEVEKIASKVSKSFGLLEDIVGRVAEMEAQRIAEETFCDLLLNNWTPEDCARVIRLLDSKTRNKLTTALVIQYLFLSLVEEGRIRADLSLTDDETGATDAWSLTGTFGEEHLAQINFGDYTLFLEGLERPRPLRKPRRPPSSAPQHTPDPAAEGDDRTTDKE